MLLYRDEVRARHLVSSQDAIGAELLHRLPGHLDLKGGQRRGVDARGPHGWLCEESEVKRLGMCSMCTHIIISSYSAAALLTMSLLCWINQHIYISFHYFNPLYMDYYHQSSSY